MLALSLVALCALPLIRAPALYAQKQVLALEEIQLQLASEKALGEIKEKLYSQSLSWEEITSAEKKPLKICEDTFILAEGFPTYRRTCSLKTVQLKEGKNQELWAKLLIEIRFAKTSRNTKEKKFLHILTLCQKALPQESNYVAFD